MEAVQHQKPVLQLRSDGDAKMVDAVPAQKKPTGQAMDHSFKRFSVIPSVCQVVDIPLSASDSFNSGENHSITCS